VDPGAHSIKANAKGREPKIYELEIARGETKDLTLALGPEIVTEAPSARPKVATPRVTQPEKPKSNPPVAGYVIGGVGVLALVTSGVAGAIVLSKKGTVNDECRGEFCSAKGLDAADSGKTWSTVATVSFAGGVILSGIGAYLVLSSSGDKTTAVRARPLALSVEQTF
jgi:hypothetical protein